MSEIGLKVKQQRIKLGLSQEELAQLTSLSVRTIQRIETGENQPRGSSLQLLATGLQTDVTMLTTEASKDNFTFLIFFHLSPLCFLLFPLGNLVAPLALRLLKNKDSSLPDNWSQQTIYVQILWSLIAYTTLLAFVFFKLMHGQVYGLFFYAYICLCGLNVLTILYANFQFYKTQKLIHFPFLLKLVGGQKA